MIEIVTDLKDSTAVFQNYRRLSKIYDFSFSLILD